MAPHWISGRSNGAGPAGRVACLLAILLTIASPLRGVACSLIECSSTGSESKGQCRAMVMPGTSATSCAAPTPTCCQQDQPLTRTVQREVNLRAHRATLAITAPENPSVIVTQIQTANTSLSSVSPPDRHTLFCTLLI